MTVAAACLSHLAESGQKASTIGRRAGLGRLPARKGRGQEIAIPRGYRLRPVEAMQAWLAAAEISSGPVFRSVG
jgi:hypothetical protein